MAEEKDGMTPDERMAWLRERGVQVSTPEERNVARVADAMKLANGLADEFTYVLVPADTTKPLQERTAPAAKAGDVLVDHLASSFAGQTDNIDIELLKQQTGQTLVGSTGAPASVSDESLRKVAAEASVETFTLVHPVESNKYTAIHIYLDEAGLLKRLPLNKRASAYAAKAGFNPPPQFYGDVFLGRILKKPIVKNMSFSLGQDTAPDAPWLVAAMTENLEHQMGMNQLTGRDQVQPSVAGTEKAKEEEGFSWTQTEEELEVVVMLPGENTKAKELQIKFLPQTLKVSHQGSPLMNIRLFERVDVDSCTWTIESGSDSTKRLVISMEKMVAAYWPRIID